MGSIAFVTLQQSLGVGISRYIFSTNISEPYWHWIIPHRDFSKCIESPSIAPEHMQRVVQVFWLRYYTFELPPLPKLLFDIRLKLPQLLFNLRVNTVNRGCELDIVYLHLASHLVRGDKPVANVCPQV